MNTLYFLFLILFLSFIVVVKKLNIKKQQIISFTITILIFMFLYFLPIICIKVFSIFCDYYEPQLSSYAFVVWYFIIYISVALIRFVLSFCIALYILFKTNTISLILKKYNLIILLIALILDFIIYNIGVQNGIVFNLSHNNAILYSLFYSITIIYLPILTAFSFMSFVDFIKNRKK